MSADGRHIELHFDSRLVRTHGSDRWAGNADARGAQGFQYQLTFSNIRIKTTLIMESGVRRCVGFQTVPSGGGKIELTFLKATTTPIAR